jgi:outer membrane lipoprotein-sorting protein
MRWLAIARPAVLILLAVLVGGCGFHRPRALRQVTVGELLEGLTARRVAVTAVRGRARLKTGLSELWVREAVLVRRPDAIRIDVLSPFGLALAVGVQGDLLWAYPPARGARYEGRATPANLVRFLGTPIAVADVVDVLLGVPPAREPVAPPLASGTQAIWFAGDTLLVHRAEETREGDVVLRVTFEEYEDGFPRRLDLAGEGDRSARLTYDAVETNAVLDPSLFAPPPAPRVLPLEAAPSPETS